MGSRNDNKKLSNYIFYRQSYRNLHCITSYSTRHCAKCECFNVNKMLCLKGVYVSFPPEQDPHTGHNRTSHRPKQDSSHGQAGLSHKTYYTSHEQQDFCLFPLKFVKSLILKVN